MSVATIEANSESTSLVNTTYVTFLSFQVTVAASTKGSATMREKFQKLFAISQDADADAALSVYKTITTHDVDGTPAPISEKYFLEDPIDIPNSIITMSNFFF